MKKMKKLSCIAFTLLLAMLVSTNTFAQKPTKGNVTGEVELNFIVGSAPISIFAPTLNGRYFLSDALAARLKFGIISSKEKTGSDSHSESSTTFSPGIEKHYAGTDKLSPYIGAELPISMGKVEDGSTAGTVTSKTSAFGVNLVFGADYYVWQNIYIGAEVTWGYNSKTETPAAGEKTTTTGFSLGNNSGIRLGIKF